MGKSLSFKVTKSSPCVNGEAVSIYVTLSGENEGEEEKKVFTVSSEDFFSFKFLSKVPCEITKEDYINLEKKALLYEAVCKGLNILSYGDNTKSTLMRKLLLKGIEKEEASFAVGYLKEHGYIDEERMLSRLVEGYAYKKFFGKKRIYLELYKKGFDKELISEKFDELCDSIDFVEICAEYMEKQKLKSSLSCREKSKKAIAHLQRQGFTFSEIKEALSRIC